MKIIEKLNVMQNIKILLPQGYSHLDDSWLYTIGNCILGKDVNDDFIAVNPDNIHTSEVYCENMSMWEEWCKLYIRQGPAQALLFLSALTPYLRPITEALQFPEKVVNAFLVGPSGCGKTSFAKLLTDAWNGSNAGVNLGTDANTFYRGISKYVDKTILIDDLNLSSSSKEMDKKLYRLSELIQLSSSGGKTEVKHQNIDKDRLGLIITGEYIPSAAAKINRCVIIKMDSEFSTKAMTTLQRHQTLYLSFIAVFVYWLINKRDYLIDLINANQDNDAFLFRGAHANASEYYGFTRVMASHKVLMAAHMLLIEFFKDMEIYSDDKEYSKLDKIMGKGINMAISDTLEAVRKESENSAILKVICEVFASDPDDIVTDDIKKYVKKDKKIFLHYYNRYYFKSELLIEYLQDKCNCSISRKAFSQELKKANLLIRYGEENSGKLPSGIIRGYEEDKCKGRYYALQKSALIDLVLSEYPEFWFRTNSPISSLRLDADR